MKQTIFENLTQNERLQVLESNCHSRENQAVKIFFTEEELAEMKSQLSDLSIDKAAFEDELKELSADLRSKIKSKQLSLRHLLVLLKDKFQEETQEVFNFDDQENGLMLTYNNQGELINSRKLRPNERQTSIINLNQKIA